MGFTRRHAILGALCCVLPAVTPVAMAKDDRDKEKRRGRDRDRDRVERVYEGREAGELKPVSELIDTVVATYGGKVVEIEFEDDEGVYEFYLLGSDGRIREIYVDGRSGKILSHKTDD